MSLLDKSVQEFKEIFEKDYKKKLTDAEAREYAERVYGLYSLLFNIAVREERRKRKLKDYPDGFSLKDERVFTIVEFAIKEFQEKKHGGI